MIRKRRNIKLSTLIILFTVLLVILASIITIVIVKNNKTDEVEKLGSNQQEDEKPRFDSNNWDNAIVAEVKQEIPIPRGFEYVSGDKDTGIIVENEKKGIEMMWIPYNEEANELDTSKYFAKVDNYEEADSDILKSMQKYGGFFAYLYTGMKYSELENITKEQYNELIKYDDLNDYVESIHTHLLCKQELQQIEYYLKNSKVEILIGTTGVTIEPYSNLYIDENSVTTSSMKDNSIKVAAIVNKDMQAENKQKIALVHMLQDVPIPVGYKYEVDKKGNVSIQDVYNKNLIYVWVPLKESEINSRKSAIKSLYENWKSEDGEKIDTTEGSELYEVFNSTEEELSDEFKESIKQYGGFYISEAELSYDADNKYYNKARGMVNYSATETKTGGDYFRKNAKYEEFTYHDMVEISSKVASGNQNVVSHLAYGVEYDAAVLWIQKTNKDYKDSKGNDITTILMQNSTYVGKYSNSNQKSTETAIKSSEFFNGIWGLGGNLAEITQEKYKIKKENKKDIDGYIARGGSYATTGQVAPIASRKIESSCSSNAIGFRVCLYVVPNAIKTIQRVPKFEKDYEGYENEIPKEEETTNQETTNPGTTNPGVTNPGTTNQETTNPGTTNPGTTNPGTTNPGTTQYPTIAKNSNTIKVGESGRVAVTVPTGWSYTTSSGTGAAVTNIEYNNGYISYKGAKAGSETISIYFKYQNGESYSLSHFVIVKADTTQTQPQQPQQPQKPTQYPTIAKNSNTIKVGESARIAVTVPTGWSYTTSSGTGAAVTNIEYNNGYISYKGAKAGSETISIYFKYQNGESYSLSHIVTAKLITIKPIQYPTIAKNSNTIKVGESARIAVTVPTGWSYTTSSGTGAAVTNIEYNNGYISYKGAKAGSETISIYFKYQNGESYSLSHFVIVKADTTQTQPQQPQKPTQYPTIAKNSNTIKVGESGRVAVTVPTGWSYTTSSGTGAAVTNIEYNNGYVSYKGSKAGSETISIYFKYQNGETKTLTHAVSVQAATQTQPQQPTQPEEPVTYPTLSGSTQLTLGERGRVTINNLPKGWKFSYSVGSGLTGVQVSGNTIYYYANTVGTRKILVSFTDATGKSVNTSTYIQVNISMPGISWSKTQLKVGESAIVSCSDPNGLFRLNCGSYNTNVLSAQGTTVKGIKEGTATVNVVIYKRGTGEKVGSQQYTFKVTK